MIIGLVIANKEVAIMGCEFCDFNRVDTKEWTIELYQETSYKYKGRKYFLEVEYPADGKSYHYVKGIEVNFCPKCGRRLDE